MNNLQLERLKREYLWKKMFANQYSEQDKAELNELRNKINILKSALYGWN